MFPIALIGRLLEELKRPSMLTLEKAERLAMVNRGYLPADQVKALVGRGASPLSSTAWSALRRTRGDGICD
jgi:hypothetical protein